jgi:hypothetical protein
MYVYLSTRNKFLMRRSTVLGLLFSEVSLVCHIEREEKEREREFLLST